MNYLVSSPMKIATHLFNVQNTRGLVKVMCAGDSLMAGSGNNMGYRLPIALGLAQMGLSCRYYGAVTDSAAQARFLYNSFGNSVKHHSTGNITTTQFIDGSSTLPPFAAALAVHTPDIVFVAITTNDVTGYEETYSKLLAIVAEHNRTARCALVVFSTHDSNSTTAKDYDIDTGRSDRVDVLEGVFTSTAYSRSLSLAVDARKAMGLWTPYPTTDVTLADNNANAVFVDSTHLTAVGSMFTPAYALGAIFGEAPSEIMRRLAMVQPYSPINGAFGADVAAAGTSDIIDSGDRKRVLTSLTAYNTHASTTATVTLNKFRQDQDGTTTDETVTAEFAFKVAPGATRGWTWPFNGPLASGATGPVSWYNEGWRVAVAGADCNIQATYKTVVA